MAVSERALERSEDGEDAELNDDAVARPLAEQQLDDSEDESEDEEVEVSVLAGLGQGSTAARCGSSSYCSPMPLLPRRSTC